jgi:hypothetical protein
VSVTYVCRHCLRPITWETRTEPGYLPREGWYDDQPAEPRTCFRALSYQHDPQVETAGASS